MALSKLEETAPQEDLIWIRTREQSTYERSTSKEISVFLVPIGCAVTVGVLATGLYNLYKKDSRKQQMCMRYRVLAQGVTVGIAMFAMLAGRK